MWIAPPYFRATIYRIGFTILELNNLIQARYAAVRAEREAQRMSFPSQPQWDQLQASLVALSCQQPYPAAQLQQEVTVASVTSVNGITCGFERSNEGDFCVGESPFWGAYECGLGGCVVWWVVVKRVRLGALVELLLYAVICMYARLWQQTQTQLGRHDQHPNPIIPPHVSPLPCPHLALPNPLQS
jgi:hypothetical protein